MKMKKKTQKTVPVKGRARAALRIKLQKSIEAARQSRTQRRKPLTIPRTVELVDQETDDWRSEKSQLMFMTAMGLTPKSDWKGMVPLSLTVDEHLPSQKPSSSSSGTTETTAVVEADDDCVCLGVFEFKPVKWYPEISICRIVIDSKDVSTEKSVPKTSVTRDKPDTV